MLFFAKLSSIQSGRLILKYARRKLPYFIQGLISENINKYVVNYQQVLQGLCACNSMYDESVWRDVGLRSVFASFKTDSLESFTSVTAIPIYKPLPRETA